MLDTRSHSVEKKGENAATADFKSFDELRKKYLAAESRVKPDTFDENDSREHRTFTDAINSITGDNYATDRADHCIPLMNLAIEIDKMPDDARAKVFRLYHRYLRDFNLSRLSLLRQAKNLSLTIDIDGSLRSIEQLNKIIIITNAIINAINSLPDQQHKVKWITILSDHSYDDATALLRTFPWREIGGSFKDIHQCLLSCFTVCKSSSVAFTNELQHEQFRNMIDSVKQSKLEEITKVTILKIMLHYMLIPTAFDYAKTKLGMYDSPLDISTLNDVKSIESLIETFGFLTQLVRLMPQEEVKPKSSPNSVADAGVFVYEAGKDEARKILSDKKMSLESIVLLRESAQAVADIVENEADLARYARVLTYKQKIDLQPREQWRQNIGKGFRTALQMFAIAAFILIVAAVVSATAPVNLIFGMKIASALLVMLGIASVVIPCCMKNTLLTPFSKALGFFAPLRDKLASEEKGVDSRFDASSLSLISNDSLNSDMASLNSQNNR